MKTEIIAKNITLRTDTGQWLGQVVITSDGMFASVTDYGNFSYAWRSFGEDFEEFLLSLSVGYFASKMQNGLSYVVYNNKTVKACQLFAEMILPALQKELKK